MLKVYCPETNTTNNWDDFLEEINSGVNSSFNRSLGDTPFFILYNFDKNSVFVQRDDESQRTFYGYDDYFRSLQYQRKLVEKYFRDHLDKEMDKYLEECNKGRKHRSLQVGQRVYMKYIPKPGESKKLCKKWAGPLTVKEILSSTKYLLESSRPRKVFTVNIDNILSRGSILEQNECVQKV